jgi:hypothetical protein
MKDKTTEQQQEPNLEGCFNCIYLGIKPSSGKHWCTNTQSYLSGWITQPHIRKCELHVLEK